MINLPPIYTEAYHLAQLILKHSVQLPRAYRSTLGRRMEDGAIDIVVTLRQELLKPASLDLRLVSQRIDELKVLIQLAHDLGLLRDHLFGELAHAAERIGKMTGGISGNHAKPKRGRTPVTTDPAL